MKMYLKKLFQNLKSRVNTNKHQNKGNEKEEGYLEKKERDLEKRMNCMNKFFVKHYLEIVKAIQEKDAQLKITIHQNTHPIYKKLSEKGAEIYYCPKKLKALCGVNDKGSGFLMLPYEKENLVIEITPPKWPCPPSTLVYDKLSEYINVARRKSYFIPPESIDAVFDMIEQKEEPAKIVEYLKRKSTG